MLIHSSLLVVLGTLLSKAQSYIEDGNVIEDFLENDWLAPAHESFQTVTPPCCQNPGIEEANIVLLSTMNGKLVALDVAKEGQVLWEVDLEGSPLLSGTLSKSAPMEANGRWYHLVPALDGSLYMYSRDDRVLEPIPLNTEILLQSSVRIAQDAVAGGKLVTTTGVDPLTGEIRYHCTAMNCNNGYNENVQSTLVFRRSTNSVRAVNALTGAEHWNLSVSEYEASLVKASNTIPYNNRISGLRLLVQPPDGIVSAYDGCGNLAWSQNVGSHIVKSWKIENGELSEISLFDPYNIHTLAVASEFNDAENGRVAESLFYLGMSNNDPFIIHSGSVKSELQRMARNALEAAEVVHQPGSQLISSDTRAYFVQGRTLDDLLRFNFGQSYTAKQSSELIEDRSTELKVVNPKRNDGHIGSCPNGDGISLIKEEDMKSATFDNGPGDKGWFVMKPGEATLKPMPFLIKKAKQCAAQFAQKHGDSLWVFSIGWIVGITTTTLSLGGVLAYFIFSWKRSHEKHPLNEPKPKAIIQTRETSSGPSISGNVESIPPASPESTPPAPNTRKGRTTSGNSSSSTDSYGKFISDFEPEKLLGHGGFGYVYQARNHLDQGIYAVKRIAVANNEKAKQKVLREVRAMARLEHRGLTRYYHTWIESPPAGWQEETDFMILEKINMRRKKCNETELEEQKIVAESTEAGTSASLAAKLLREDSVEAPPMPENSDDGSWLGSTSGKDQQDDSSDSSSSSGSENNSSVSQKIGKVTPQEDTGFSDIIFGNASKSSKHSEALYKHSNQPQMALVTSVDEELLPSRNTENVVYLYIQMQLCQEKTLHSWLKRHKLKEHRVLSTMNSWLVQLCSVVNYIHSEGLIHRDLKPQNIFFVDHDCQHLKVGDLGLITGNVPDEQTEKFTNSSSNSLYTGNVGTRGYMSPEQIANKPYTFKIDVFSLGLIYCELIIPFQTFMERSETLGSLQRGEIPSNVKNCGKEEKEMILWMTRTDPDKRPTTEEILQSDYLCDVDDSFPSESLKRLQSERTSSSDKRKSP